MSVHWKSRFVQGSFRAWTQPMRWCHNIMSSFTGWALTQNDPCCHDGKVGILTTFVFQCIYSTVYHPWGTQKDEITSLKTYLLSLYSINKEWQQQYSPGSFSEAAYWPMLIPGIKVDRKPFMKVDLGGKWAPSWKIWGWILYEVIWCLFTGAYLPFNLIFSQIAYIKFLLIHCNW